MAFDYKRMLKKETNLSERDVVIRRNVGIGCVVLSIIPGSILLLLLGIVLIASASMRWCPVYSALHKNSLVA